MPYELIEDELFQPRTIWSELRKRANQTPDRVFLEADGREPYTFRSLANCVTRTAAELRLRRISSGDHVAIVLGNSAEWIIVWTALSSIGAVTVAVNLLYTPRELKYVLQQARVTAVVGSRQSADDSPAQSSLESVAADLEGVAYIDIADVCNFTDENIASKEENLLEDDCDVHGGPLVPGLLQYTSGTTSLPKGVLLSQAQLVANGLGFARRLNASEEDRVWSAMPLYHCAGTVGTYLLSLVAGSELILVRRFNGEMAVEEIRDRSPTLVIGVEAMWQRMMAIEGARHAFRSVRAGWLTGSGTTLKRVAKDLGVPGILNLYGTTEGSPNVTCSHVDEPLDVRVASNGMPQPGVNVSIVDPDNRQELTIGEVGEIRFRGWNRMLRYWDDETATSESVDDDGWFYTGDSGYVRSDGRLVYVGRYKDMLRVGGENVAAVEIEELVVSSLDFVRSAQVTALRHNRLGDVVWLFVEVTDGIPDVCDRIREVCRRDLAKFKQPRAISSVASWPLTGSGKVQKNRLPDWHDASLLWVDGDSEILLPESVVSST